MYPIIFILLGVSEKERETHTHTHTQSVDHDLAVAVSTCVQSNNIIINKYIHKILYLKETHNLCFRRG